MDDQRPPSRQNSTSLGPNDEPFHKSNRPFKSHKTGTSRANNSGSTSGSASGIGKEKKEKDCDRLRPEEEDRSRLDNMVNMSPALLRQTVTPYLKEHIPALYAPIGKPENEEVTRRRDPNSRYCYRHSPDSKCRKAADEKKMAMIQSELDKLSPADQQAITHVWSFFSAAPSKSVAPRSSPRLSYVMAGC
jgi:F-box/WD-40 domain protein MET30